MEPTGEHTGFALPPSDLGFVPPTGGRSIAVELATGRLAIMEPGGGRCTAVEPSEGKSAAMEPGRGRSTTVELIASRSTAMEPGEGRSTAVEPDGGAAAPLSRASLGHACGPTPLDPFLAALCHHSEGVGRPARSREGPLCHGCARLPLSCGQEGSPWPLREKGLHRRSVWG